MPFYRLIVPLLPVTLAVADSWPSGGRRPCFRQNYHRVSITLESGQRLSMFKRDTAVEQASHAPRMG